MVTFVEIMTIKEKFSTIVGNWKDKMIKSEGKLLSVSASQGPVFRRYLLNGPIDQDETWAQGVSACDLIFHNILL